MAKNRASDDPTQQIDQLNQVVVQLYQQGRYQEAIALATQARDLARQHLGQDHPDYATSLNNLATLYQAMGDHAAALPLYRQALEIRRTALGENHPDYAEPEQPGGVVPRRWATTPPLYPSAARPWRSTAPRWARTTRTTPTA